MTARIPHAYPSADAVRTLMRQGHAWIAELAEREGWPPSLQADLQDRFRRQPAATVAGTVEHFRLRLVAAHERERERARAVAPSIPPRWCPGCDGSCVGTRRSCVPGRPTSKPVPELPMRGHYFTPGEASPHWLQSWRERRARARIETTERTRP